MRLVALLLLSISVVPAARGQDRDFGPLVLRVAGGARALGIANAAVASREDEAVFHNPAQLLVQRGIGGSYESFAHGSLITLASAQTSGSLGIGVGARHLEYQSLTAGAFPADARWLESGGPRTATSTALDVALARTVKGLRVGAGVTYAESRASDVRTRHVLGNLGVSRGNQVSVGIALQHLAFGLPTSEAIPLDAGGQPVGEERIPTTLAVGVNGTGYPLGPFDLAGGAAVGVRRDGRVLPRLGVELGYSWIEGYAVQLRGGVRRPEIAHQGPLTLGAGVSRDNLSLDYAWERVAGPVGSHRVGVRVR